MKSLLVIGGTGFFGKSILDSFSRGKLNKWDINKVYILARDTDILKTTNPELLGNSVDLINADISNCTELPNAEYIIHAAASSDASKYLESPEGEQKNILLGTINFCRLMMNVNQSKILYVSSGAVYGSTSLYQTAFSEDDRFLPLYELDKNKKNYTAAKRDSEVEILKLGKAGVKVSIARCFSFVGKYLPRNQHFAIGNFIRDALNGEQIRVTAQPLVYRSYMHADDLVEWLMNIVNVSSDNCPVYNVGSNAPIEIRELAKKVGKLLNTCVDYREPTIRSVDYYIPATYKAKAELGLELSINLEQAIKMTIEGILSSK